MHYHLTTDKTIDAKHVFKRPAEQHGVRILHYHCDNGRFTDKVFVDDVRMAHQTITFCGVGAHHQNGVAKRCIQDITENAHTSLLHAAHRWPKAIAANLWPQAIKHVVNVRNSLPQPGKTESPLSKFTGMSLQPNLKHFHPFGCPVYVLQAPLQTRSPFPKWGECSRIGIFLCHSPIMDHPSCWFSQPKEGLSVHNSTVCLTMTSTLLEKNRLTRAFGKQKLFSRRPRKE